MFCRERDTFTGVEEPPLFILCKTILKFWPTAPNRAFCCQRNKVRQPARLINPANEILEAVRESLLMKSAAHILAKSASPHNQTPTDQHFKNKRHSGAFHMEHAHGYENLQHSIKTRGSQSLGCQKERCFLGTFGLFHKRIMKCNLAQIRKAHSDLLCSFSCRVQFQSFLTNTHLQK